jgi:hypothetical protein
MRRYVSRGNFWCWPWICRLSDEKRTWYMKGLHFHWKGNLLTVSALYLSNLLIKLVYFVAGSKFCWSKRIVVVYSGEVRRVYCNTSSCCKSTHRLYARNEKYPTYVKSPTFVTPPILLELEWWMAFNYLPWKMDLGSIVNWSDFTDSKKIPDDQKGHLFVA